MQATSQQDLNRARALAVEGELNAFQAQTQTNQRLYDLQAHGLQTGLPAPVAPVQPVKADALNPALYPTIPDSALAASRARVVDASRNKR